MALLRHGAKYFKESIASSSPGFKSVRFSSKVPILYCDPVAPPARFVLMAAKHLGLQLNLAHVDLFRGEQYSEEFQKTNPLQKVPVLQDGDLVIKDSHAIAMYLCEKTNATSLYPTSPEARANIHQMLFFNSGILFPIDSALMGNYFAGVPLDQKLLGSWRKALDFLEYMLEKHQWLSGDSLSLADLCCVATVSSVGLLRLLPPAAAAPRPPHPALNGWSRRLRELPCYSANEDGLATLRDKIAEYKNKA